MISLILIGLLCLFLVIVFVYYATYWSRQNVPYVPLKFPFIYGSISSEKHQALQFADFVKHHRMNQPIIGFYLGFYGFIKSSLLIVDPTLIRCVLSENFQNFQNRGMFYNEIDDPLSAILGTLNHDKWKPIRTKLTKAFTPAQIKQMFGSIKTLGDELVKGLNEIIETNDNVEIRDLFSRFTTDVMGRVTIGIECNTLKGRTQLREMAKKAMQPHLKFYEYMLTTTFPKFSRWPLRIRKHPKDVTDFFVNVVEQTIQHRRANNEERNDYMQLLIDSGLTTNEIAALAFDLLSAGYSDSTSTLAYCLYELALQENKHIQNKARDEIRSILKRESDELTYDALEQMSYIKQIINETLRKHPVAGNLSRMTNKPYKVPNSDFTIPTGMRVFIPVYAIHHDEQHYHDPEEFIPERFAEQPKSGVYLPFGDGPRQCIGYRFAKLLISIGLVSFLRNFEFSTCDRTQIPIKYSSTKNTLIPSNGVWLKVKHI